jgi:N-methylhydantoinase B
MRFSENGYYVERYVKCANCGPLVYGEGLPLERDGTPLVFCSEWCIRWSELRASGRERWHLPIEQPAPRATDRPLDMVTMNIVDSSMVSLCREMGILLMRTSYSTIFNEGLDFTCAFADTKGDMIACAEFCPTMIGGMPLLIKTCAQFPRTRAVFGRSGWLRRRATWLTSTTPDRRSWATPRHTPGLPGS